MLTEMEAQLKSGNQVTGFQYFWTSVPEEFLGDEYQTLGEVSDEELLADPASAEEAYCGDGDSVSTLSESLDFVSWLVDQGYALAVAIQCAANLARFHAE